MLHGECKKATTFVATAHRHTQLQKSLAQPTMLLAFCAEGFAHSLCYESMALYGITSKEGTPFKGQKCTFPLCPLFRGSTFSTAQITLNLVEVNLIPEEQHFGCACLGIGMTNLPKKTGNILIDGYATFTCILRLCA